MAQLTDDEKGKIAWHLGWTEYPQVLNVSGIVVDHNIVTMLRRNIEECPDSALGRVRRCLCECDKIIDQISAAREKFGVKQVDGIVLDASEQMRLLEAFANQTALALEVDRLGEEAREAKLAADRLLRKIYRPEG